MITVTEQFVTQINKSSRSFRARLLYDDVSVGGELKKITITKGACGDTFSIGSLFSSSIEVVMDECEEVLENKELLLQIGLVLDDESVEYVDLGYYTVTKPKVNVYQKTFTGYGRIASKLNVQPDLPAVQTLSDLAAAITAKTGVPIICKGVTLAGTIEKDLTGMTCKEILEVIVSVLGGFGTEDSAGNIVICKFSNADPVDYDGDRTTTLAEFNEYDYNFTGVKVIVTEEYEDEDGNTVPEVSFTQGVPRQTLANEYMTAALFPTFAANIVGFTFRPGTVPIALGDPRLEPWDCLQFTDIKGASHIVPCMNIVHTFDGGLSTTVTAPGASESEDEAQTKGPVMQQLERINALIFTAQDAILKRLKADEAELLYAKVETLEATDARIDTLSGEFLSYKEAALERVEILEADVLQLDAKALTAEKADLLYASIGTVDAMTAHIDELETDIVKTSQLEAEIAKLGYATADEIAATYLKAADAALLYVEIGTFDAVVGRVEDLEADTLKTSQLEAEVAKLGYASADELKAVSAEVGSISGDFATYKETTTDTLSAQEADIEALKAKDVELDTALIGKASVGDLEALVTRTGDLEADYAEIYTLVNGNLTSENIQSLVISGNKFTIEEGFIKSAMIESLAFDKITGLDINTTRFTVHSDDGLSTWADNTIQISDKSRVRVQIGEDASGDYTLAVWDAAGNLIWDALGATEDTIQRAIIKDAMVATDAAIHGSKLDIETVIEEVNGAETAIKATQIHLDTENQSLDAAFSALKTYSEDTYSRTESNLTAIGVIQGQVSTLISDTTIEKDGETVLLKDAYSATLLEVDSIKTTLSEHTSLIDEQSGQILAVESKTNTIESDLSGTKQTITEVQSDLAGTNSKVTELETTAGKLEVRIAANEESISDAEDRIAAAETTIKAQAGEIDLMVKESDLTGDYIIGKINLTSTTATIEAAYINLTGAVTIAALAEDASEKLDDAYTEAAAAASRLDQWSYEGDTTYINGGMIYTETIMAEQVNTTELFSQDIVVSGDFKLGGHGALEYNAQNDKLDICASSITLGTSAVVTDVVLNASIDGGYVPVLDADGKNTYEDKSGNTIQLDSDGYYYTDSSGERVDVTATDLLYTYGDYTAYYTGDESSDTPYYYIDEDGSQIYISDDGVALKIKTEYRSGITEELERVASDAEDSLEDAKDALSQQIGAVSDAQSGISESVSGVKSDVESASSEFAAFRKKVEGVLDFTIDSDGLPALTMQSKVDGVTSDHATGMSNEGFSISYQGKKTTYMQKDMLVAPKTKVQELYISKETVTTDADGTQNREISDKWVFLVRQNNNLSFKCIGDEAGGE